VGLSGTWAASSWPVRAGGRCASRRCAARCRRCAACPTKRCGRGSGESGSGLIMRRGFPVKPVPAHRVCAPKAPQPTPPWRCGLGHALCARRAHSATRPSLWPRCWQNLRVAGNRHGSDSDILLARDIGRMSRGTGGPASRLVGIRRARPSLLPETRACIALLPRRRYGNLRSPAGTGR
jgi:hypothetical protein